MAGDSRVVTVRYTLRPSAEPAVHEDLVGSTVGRYHVLEVLGRGGMGLIYRAHDPYLSRDIALKVVASRSEDEQALLLQEAQALARLSHPNVVSAFDVGAYDGGIFIALELIRGTSLQEWAAPSRTIREALPVVLAAARGLAAAHAAGILHCDFKPSNVMVSPDGRVRVVDFGLAMALGDGGWAPTAHGDGDVVVQGTLGYMAPEQIVGGAADARADQFAFAATAFFVLTGRRAYGGATFGEYRDALIRGARSAWPGSVPRRIRQVVDRGLAIRSGERFATMAELISALERAARVRPVSLALACAALAGAAWLAWPGAEHASCAVGPDAFAAAWGVARHADIARAFDAARSPQAADAVARVAARLDAVRDSWLAMSRQSCEATFVHHRQTELVHNLRQHCRDRRRAEGGTLTRLLADDPDPDLRSEAALRVAEVGSVDDCADAATLVEAAGRLPAAPVGRAMATAVAGQLDAAHVFFLAGRRSEAVALASSVLPLAEQTRDRATIARAYLEIGIALHAMNRAQDGQAALLHGLDEATRGDVPGLIAAAQAALLDGLIAMDRFAEAEHSLPFARATILHAGGPRERVQLHLTDAAIASNQDHFDAAHAALRLAEHEAEALGPISSQRMKITRELAIALELAGDLEGALREHRRATELARQIYGPSHPAVVRSWNNVAAVLSAAGRHAEALAAIGESRALAAQLPRDAPEVISLGLVEGAVWQARGELARAIPLFQEAVARFDAASPEALSPNALRARIRLGKALLAAGRGPEAIPQFERWLAQRIAERSALDWQAEAGFWLAQALWTRPTDRRRALAVAADARSRYREAGAGFASELAEVEAWLAARSPAH